MSMLDRTVDQRVLVSLLSSHPMTLAMLFNSSMATIGKAAHLRSVRIVSQARGDPVGSVEAAVDSVEDLVGDLVVGVALAEAVEALAAASVEVVGDMEADSVADRVSTQMLLQLRQTHSPTMQLPAQSAVRPSMSAM
jgi:hypothetical protein